MPRAPRKPLFAIVFSGNMGHNGTGCWVLVSHADTPEVAEGYRKYRVYDLLSHRRRAGRREGQEGQRNAHSGSFASELE